MQIRTSNLIIYWWNTEHVLKDVMLVARCSEPMDIHNTIKYWCWNLQLFSTVALPFNRTWWRCTWWLVFEMFPGHEAEKRTWLKKNIWSLWSNGDHQSNHSDSGHCAADFMKAGNALGSSRLTAGGEWQPGWIGSRLGCGSGWARSRLVMDLGSSSIHKIGFTHLILIPASSWMKQICVSKIVGLDLSRP